jgi:hypothetical protein
MLRDTAGRARAVPLRPRAVPARARHDFTRPPHAGRLQYEAFPLAPVREDTAGGAEQVLRLVDAGLVVRGHRSVVLASEGSRVRGRLFTAPRAGGRLDRDAWCRAHERYRKLVGPIVEHGRTGFLVSTVAEMADAIAATSGLRSEHCRQAAIERFSAESMVDRYIEVYRKLAA